MDRELGPQENEEIFLQYYLGDEYASFVAARDSGQVGQMELYRERALEAYRLDQARNLGASVTEDQLRRGKLERRRRVLALVTTVIVALGGATGAGVWLYRNYEAKAAAEQVATEAKQRADRDRQNKIDTQHRQEIRKLQDRVAKEVVKPLHLRLANGTPRTLTPGQAGWARLDDIGVDNLDLFDLTNGKTVAATIHEDAKLQAVGPDTFFDSTSLLVAKQADGRILIYILNADCYTPNVDKGVTAPAIEVSAKMLPVDFCPYLR